MAKQPKKLTRAQKIAASKQKEQKGTPEAVTAPPHAVKK